MTGFCYPTNPHSRKHGPEGYRDYSSFRDWLRDEFTFRCVFCLHREQWYNRTGTFNIEHFIPVAIDESGRCDYSNLLYACSTCNNAKRAILGVPDPCSVAFGDCLVVRSHGEIDALNAEGKKLVGVLRLNSESNVDNRRRWIRNLANLRVADPELFEEYMGFPRNLPDLRTKHVKSNSKPDGVQNCYFSIRERGELEATY
ncbi:HNH endonuclease [Rosistilla oblonga]|uniref:HNH endonuclease n=1 Tax=Rosistilla oblonga TaxID=2527990 RepID=UPI003A96E689